MTKQTEKTGPRADLTKAILARDAAAQRVDELRTSIARVEDERFSARQKLDAAAREADESNSRDEVIERLIVGDTGAAVLELGVDRREATDAERVIETSDAALSLLRAELADAERSLELRTRRVQDAAGGVIATEALDAIVADAARLRGELAACEETLNFLHQWIPRAQAAKIERALAASPAHGPHPAVDTWCAAIESLMADATTELPK